MSSNKIFVVEDDGDIRSILQELLVGAGYEVISAENGIDALHVLRSHKDLPGLIILDLMMPEMDGFRFRQEQERDARIAAIPVVVLTAAAGNLEEKRLRVGAKAILKKPVTIDQVLQVVAQYLQ